MQKITMKKNITYQYGTQREDTYRDKFGVLEDVIVADRMCHCLLEDILGQEEVPNDLEED